MFYLSGKNSDSSNNGRPPYFEYINCLPYLQGSSPLLQTWSTCNKSCVDNNWKPIRDVCVANEGSVDFNYSFIRVGTTGSDDQIMVNCAYGGESVFGYQTEFFESTWANMWYSYKTLSMDTVVAYSTGFTGLSVDANDVSLYVSSLKTGGLLMDSVEGARITGITGMTGGFGCSVSQKGDLVAVGAYLDRYPDYWDWSARGKGSFGKVYIYNTGGVLINEIYPPEGDADGDYPASADSGPSGGRGFGKSVALIGNEAVLIGAPFTSGFVTGSYPGGAYEPYWVEKAGVSYIYSTGGQLLHTLSGSATGEYGLTSEANEERLLGWQGEANETSVVAATPGLTISTDYEWYRKQLAFYGTGGNYLNTIGPKFSTQGFEGADGGVYSEWSINFWTLASNSQAFYTNRIGVGYGSAKESTDIKSFANDGSYLSSVRMPTKSSPYAGGAIDASEKYLLMGDAMGPGYVAAGNLWIMETGDLFLKEIPSPNSIPFFGHQVAANNDTYAGMNESGLLAYSLSGAIPFTGFTGQVGAAFDQWKGLLESVFTGATINFINLGLETGTTIGSNASQASYPLNSHIGNTRIGMEPEAKRLGHIAPVEQ